MFSKSNNTTRPIWLNTFWDIGLGDLSAEYLANGLILTKRTDEITQLCLLDPIGGNILEERKFWYPPPYYVSVNEETFLMVSKTDQVCLYNKSTLAPISEEKVLQNTGLVYTMIDKQLASWSEELSFITLYDILPRHVNIDKYM